MTQAIETEANLSRAQEGEAIKALTKLLGENLKSLDAIVQQHYVSAVALTSMLACLPGAADLDIKSVGAVVGQITKGRSDQEELRRKVAHLIANVITIARDVKAAANAPEAEAKTA